jgi:hypothetical protein
VQFGGKMPVVWISELQCSAIYVVQFGGQMPVVLISELQCSAIVCRAVWWTNASVYKAPATFMFRVKAGSSEELISTYHKAVYSKVCTSHQFI